MARKRGGGRRNFSKFISGNIDVDLNVSTLATKAAVGDVTQTVIDTARISSIRCTYSLSNWTPAVNAGPIAVYVAHSDYVASEVEEFIETTGGWDLGNKIAQEIRSRRIRLIGVFQTPADALAAVRLNDGKPITTKLNWVMAEGDGLKFLAYNTGAANVSGTTNPNLNVFGKANIWMT